MAVAAAAVVVVLRRPPRKRAPPCAPVFESTADDGEWAVAVPRLFPTPARSGGVAHGCPVSVSLALCPQLPNTALVPRRSSLFLFPSLPFSIQFLPFSLHPSFLQQLPPSVSNYEGAANTFPPPLSLSSSPPSNNNTKATNAKSVPRLCQLLSVGLVHSFSFPVHTGKGGGQGSPSAPHSFFFS